jgi:hypothetical protein
MSAYCSRLELASMMVMNHTVVYSIGLKYAFWIVENNCCLGCDAIEIVVLHCFGISLFDNIPSFWNIV